MTSCPSDQQLLWLLDEQLDRADEDRIVVHVETCSRCQGRLDELVRNRLPNPAWLPCPPAEIAAQSGPAPRSSRLEDGPGASDPAAPTDVTVDRAPIAERPTFRDPTPTEPDHSGGIQEPTDVDCPTPPDRPASCDVTTQPVADSPVTTDVIPPRSIGPIRADAIDAANGEATDVEPSKSGDRTLAQSGPSAPAPRPSPDRFQASQPEIPGYEILGSSARGDGRRLQGPAAGPESPGGPQDDHRREPGAGRAPGPLPDRGRGGRPAPAPEHRADLRHRRSGRPAVRVAGAARRRGPRRSAGEHAPARPVRSRADGHPGPGRPRGPSGRDHPPRPQAGQHPVHRRRRPQDHRLRPGQAAGIGQPPDRDRPDHGHAQLHGPRAGPGAHQGRRTGGRHLRAGRDPLRGPDRASSVQGRDADGDGPPGHPTTNRSRRRGWCRGCRATWRPSA